jgi:hypothetical protein
VAHNPHTGTVGGALQDAYAVNFKTVSLVSIITFGAPCLHCCLIQSEHRRKIDSSGCREDERSRMIQITWWRRGLLKDVGTFTLSQQVYFSGAGIGLGCLLNKLLRNSA